MSIDHAVADFVADHRSTLLTPLVNVVTTLGDVATLASGTVLVVATLVAWGRRRDAVTVLVGMAGASGLTVGIKNLVRRERPGPELRLGAIDHSFAFPSGHTLNTTVFVAMLLLALWPVLGTRLRRRAAVSLGVACALGVGASRIYLGYHWLTDVLGGLVIGAAWAALVLTRSRGWRSVVPRPAETGSEASVH